MKLLEEDEDESMHSGADVDAFQAALNRDIGGDVSTSQPSDSESALVQGNDSSSTSSQPMAQWQNASQDENTNFHTQQGLESARLQEQHLQQMEQKQHGSVAENQQQQQNESSVSEEHNRNPLQHKQSQDDCQQGQVEEKTPSQVSQTTGIQISEKNPVAMHVPERIQNQVGGPQYSKIQKMSNQQAIGAEQPSNPMNRGKQVPFALLLPALVPHLDKDRAMQLHTLYGKLKKNEIVKDVFVRHMRDIVGDQMLRLAVNKMQSQMGSHQFPTQSQASARQQQLRMPSASAAASQFGDTQSFAQVNQKSNSPADPILGPASSVRVQVGSSYPIKENSAKKSLELEHQSGSHGIHGSQISSSTSSTVNQERERSSVVQGLNKQQQQHLHFPQTSFSMYGSGSSNYHPYSGTNVNTPGSSLKPHPHDSPMRQITHHQSMGSTPSGGVSQPMNIMNVPKFEKQNNMNDPGKVQGGSISQFTSNSTLQQSSVPWQASANKEQGSGPLASIAYVKPEPIDQGTDQPQKLHSSTPQGFSVAQAEPGSTVPGTLKDDAFEKQSPRVGFSASTSIIPSNSVSPSTTMQLDSNALSSRMPAVTSPAGVNARTPPKKPSVSQKKPVEPPGSSPPMPSKKQKVSGAFSDQSIEQLNDVTAVSGVNLREEEEQLFSGTKEDSRVSEASRRVVQEEEERLILQKTPLQKKLAQIMVKCGLKNMSNDVERCLSLCVEERMRGLLCNLIRLSKQRVDAEKTRHRTIITSDIRQQIMIMNRKAKEEWEKKQAEAEKLRKVNEPEVDGGIDGDKEKDDSRVKSVKVNKEEDDKMRTTAANVAARAAVGGDDMLSKWQLMAEQARQKREGGTDMTSGSHLGKDTNRKPLTSGRNTKDYQDAEKRSQTTPSASGSGRKFGKTQAMVSQTKVARAISVKDVIAVLEREPQMCKSTLIYRLYEKVQSDAAAAE